MKIGVFLIDIPPSSGGSFSLVDKLMKAIDAYQFRQPLEICFVGRIARQNMKFQKDYIQISSMRSQKFFHWMKKFGLLRAIRFLFSIDADLCNKRDIATLRKSKVDVLLFPKQFLMDVPGFPFMTMSWDTGHKSTYLFPEFIDSYDIREQWYRFDIQKALAIIVESQSSVEEFSNFFGISRTKLEIVPLFAGDVVSMQVPDDAQQLILKSFHLKTSEFFLYPAQFWAAKNHYNLLVAFKNLVDKPSGRHLKLILPGSDKGNMSYIKSVVKQLDLNEVVIMPGFVDNDVLFTLYKNAIALVMPTFLGPTNMPLLEAQILQTPVICSDFEGHREICGDGALYANPSIADEWTNAMSQLLENSPRQILIAEGNRMHAKSSFNIQNAIRSLEAIFIKYIPIRKTFY